MAEELGIGKSCSHCGVRSATLGTVCPACRRPYERGGLLDRLPLIAVLLAAVMAVGWVWLILSHLVAGILVGAAAFAAFVAAIGIVNALADRGR